MPTAQPDFRPDLRRDHPVAFFKGFLQRPKEVGSVIPSSRFLERQICRSAELERARVVVELGPGTGGTTRAFLQRMRSDATLLAIEINPHFVRVLSEKFDDPRLVVREGSATDLKQIVADCGLEPPDVVLSGIPFSTMPRNLGLDILRGVNEGLAPGGRFVAYQFRDRVEELGRQVFGPTNGNRLELRNVPPMRVYRWDKPSL